MNEITRTLLAWFIPAIPGIIALVFQYRRDRAEALAKEAEADSTAAGAAKNLYEPYVKEVNMLRAMHEASAVEIAKLKRELTLMNHYVAETVLGARRLVNQVCSLGATPVYTPVTLDEYRLAVAEKEKDHA
jgi:hypothetical protein